MISRWNKLLIVLALAVYIAAVALVALFYEFPYEPAFRMIRNQIEASSLLRFKLGVPRPKMPFSLSLDKLSVGAAGFPETFWLVTSDEVSIKLKPTRLASGHVSGRFKVAAWGGGIKGRFDYQLFGARTFSLSFTDINFPDFTLVDGNNFGNLTGKLQGHGTVYVQHGAGSRKGSGMVKIESGRFAGRLLPDLPRLKIDFELLELNFSLKDDQLIIESLNMRSPDINGRLTGQIKNFENPVLRLSGSVSLGPANKPKTRLNFILTGPAEKPRLRFGPSLSTHPGK